MRDERGREGERDRGREKVSTIPKEKIEMCVNVINEMTR
jgi:hypothetical protein